MKKTIVFVLALLTVLALASCGSGDDGNSLISSINKNGLFDYYILEGFDNSNALGIPETTVDPDTVYKNVKYDPRMFYGSHRLLGGTEAADKFGSEYDYIVHTYGGKEYLITELPYRIEAGPQTFSHKINMATDYYWARLYFMETYSGKTPYMNTVLCAYTVEGNKVTFKLVDKYEYHEDTDTVSFEFSNTVLTYDFAFKGRNLILSTEKESVTLVTGLEVSDDNVYLHADGYCSKNSLRPDRIEGIMLHLSEDNARINMERDNESTDNCICKIEERGVITITAQWRVEVKTYQYVYFYCGNDGLILTDGTNVYYFTEDDRTNYVEAIDGNLESEQVEKLESMPDTELENIAEKQEDLLADLTSAFENAGINVTVDHLTGELAMDASVLFGGDSAVLTDKGKAFLNTFTKVYTEIIYSEKYEGFILKTLVEGHTAPVANGTYEEGLPLSEERANNVKDYCLSAEVGVDVSKLESNLEAIGYSCSKPIYDENGEVNQAASRRVSFRFIINLEQ